MDRGKPGRDIIAEASNDEAAARTFLTDPHFYG
jgi:hypothetical protein